MSTIFFHVLRSTLPLSPVLFSPGCEQVPRPSGAYYLVTLSDIGTPVQVGVHAEDPLGVVRRPYDAVFVGDDIVVLDASPPWLRVFSRDGTYKRAFVRRGDGPGEVALPYSLAATRDGGFLLTHSRGIERLGQAGGPVASIRSEGRFWARGAVEACQERFFALASIPTRPDAPGFILSLGPQGASGDTLALLGTLRPKSQLRRHASFLETTQNGFLLYTEEADRDRLVEFDCDGRLLRQLEVDSLGAVETAGPAVNRRPGTIAAQPPKPPFPGGIAQVKDHVLWATLILDVTGDGASADSVTIITAFGPHGTAKQLAIRGWLQLFDSDDAGRLLLGNSDALYASVLLIDGVTLLRLIDERGALRTASRLDP